MLVICWREEFPIFCNFFALILREMKVCLARLMDIFILITRILNLRLTVIEILFVNLLVYRLLSILFYCSFNVWYIYHPCFIYILRHRILRVHCIICSMRILLSMSMVCFSCSFFASIPTWGRARSCTWDDFL